MLQSLLVYAIHGHHSDLAGRGGSVVELLPRDREVVSSSPASVGHVKRTTLK
jgi:hypothetical protein